MDDIDKIIMQLLTLKQNGYVVAEYKFGTHGKIPKADIEIQLVKPNKW